MKAKLCQRLHLSWLIAWLALGIIAGIAGAALAGPIHLAIIPGIFVVAALITIAFFKRAQWAIIVVVAAGLLVGFWRGEVEQIGLRQYRSLYGKVVALQGIVSDDAAIGPGGDERLSLKDIVVNGKHLNGYAWVSTDMVTSVRRSDTVTVRGKLGPGFGSVSASMFHASTLRVTRPQAGDIGLQVRDWFARGIRAAIPEPEASLAAGYLVGQRSALPPDLTASLQTVGLTHAVVASGYNLTILVSLARQLLLGASKYLATLSAATMIGGFIMISGLSPSMSRAGLVTSLMLAAWYYGRDIHPLVLLPFAAAITALFNPFYVWGDIGWYLSFSSFAGVIIIAPLVRHVLWRGHEHAGLIAEVIIDTMSAQLATLPVMLFAFGHYSPYALLANLLVLPLVPLTMLLTFVAGVFGLAAPPFARLIALPVDSILRYMIWITSHLRISRARKANLP